MELCFERRCMCLLESTVLVALCHHILAQIAVGSCCHPVSHQSSGSGNWVTLKRFLSLGFLIQCPLERALLTSWRARFWSWIWMVPIPHPFGRCPNTGQAPGGSRHPVLSSFGSCPPPTPSANSPRVTPPLSLVCSCEDFLGPPFSLQTPKCYSFTLIWAFFVFVVFIPSSSLLKIFLFLF